MILDMELINKINKRYNLKVKQVNDYIVYVYDGVGEWLIEIDSNYRKDGKNIILKHKNARRNKDGWHEQRRYYDCRWALGAIYNHKQKPFHSGNNVQRVIYLLNNLHKLPVNL
jgi:hypothetical protein